MAGFCREHGLGVPHFYWWKKRLRESTAAEAISAGRFLEVQVAAAASASGTPSDAQVEIRLRTAHLRRGLTVNSVKPRDSYGFPSFYLALLDGTRITVNEARLPPSAIAVAVTMTRISEVTLGGA